MLASIDQLPTDRAAFAVALLHLLLLPRSRTRNDVQRQIWRGRVLDVVIPGFDDVDRHAPFTVHTATPLVAPLAIRVALLAGLWRTQNNPDLYDRIESACSGRESIRFDAAKIKLLADAHPAFSHLQQIRDSSPFWSRYFLQRKRKTAQDFQSQKPPQSQDFVQRDTPRSRPARAQRRPPVRSRRRGLAIAPPMGALGAGRGDSDAASPCGSHRTTAQKKPGGWNIASGDREDAT
jgi:hypothetical protein